MTSSGGRHVEFISVDQCKEENGGPYKASIPLHQATNPVADVLFAYEMNGKVDSSGNVQPEHVETIWNLRGILNSSWHHIRLQISP
ncbi:Sulfite oxidase [Carex littledalei]|uniref:Sulfite oxidase n=1 Tax=Carex littledalei TaxID=544730 RepID=A0A833R792_9POAL|nr:Sulfite oxidase [Carex littledalei]